MPDGTAPPQGLWGRHRKRLLGGAASAVVIGAVFVFVLPRIADYRDVWEVIKDLGWQDALLLVGATVLNIATFPPSWMVALPGLGYRQALVLTQASTALSMISPAGAAVGMAGSYSMLRSWGFRAGTVALAVAVTGIWNQFANLAFPIVALALLTGVDEDHPALRTAALIGLAVLIVAISAFALALSSSRRAHQIGALAARLVSRVRRAPAPEPRHLGRRAARRLPHERPRAAQATLARAHARHSRRPPDRLSAPLRVPSRGGRLGLRRSRGSRRSPRGRSAESSERSR